LKIARISALGLVFLLASLFGCSKVGRPQAEFCERVARILFARAPIVRLESEADASKAHGILTRVTLSAANGALETHHVSCAFAGGPVSANQLELSEVSTDVEGRLSGIHLAMLNIVLEHDKGPVATAGGAEPSRSQVETVRSSPRVELLYFLQQLVNGSTLGCVVALIAVGYTLIYGIIGVINLSFGEIYMIGAVSATIGIWLLLLSGLDSYFLSLLLALPLTMALTAGYSMMSERLVFRPLRQSSTLMPLIASIGLSIVLQNYVFLVEGAQNFWLPVRSEDGIALAEADGFSLYLNRQQGVVFALTLLLAGGTWYLLARTSFGRSQRASSQDRRMAALLGVDVDRVVAATFGLGGALAAAGGLMVASYYGGANFAMGLLMGLKALTAAIVGGIGNFKGALLGGFVVAYMETFWAGYLPGAYRELAVFALLILVLIFRPQGLLGEE